MSFPTSSGFNFGGAASGQALGTQSQGSLFGGGAPTTGASSSNLFGSNLTTFGSASGSAPTFGSNAGAISFGSVQNSAASTGTTTFGFGINTTTTPAFGQPQNQPVAGNSGGGFGLSNVGSNLFAGIQSQSQPNPVTAPPSSAGGFSLGIPTPAFASSTPAPASSPAGSFFFASSSSAPATTAPTLPPISFVAPPTTTTASQPAPFSLSVPSAGASSAASTASGAGGFAFGGTTSAPISLSTSAPASTTGTGFSFDIGGKSAGLPTSGAPTTTAITTAVTSGSQPSSGTLTLPALGSNSASTTAGATFGFGASSGASTAASGGFSLGASAAGSEKMASGGFNFGTASATGKGTDQTTTGTAKETAPATSSAATKTGDFSFAAAAPTSGNAFAGLSSAPAATSASTGPVSVPSDIKDLSLDEVVNKWTDEVADLGAEFQKAAIMVSKWDRAIVGNEDKVHALHKDSQALKIAHSELSSNLDVILSQQSELHNLLDALETDVEQKIGSPVSQLNSRSNYSGKTRLHGDVERESMHRLSVEVMDELDSMTLTIRNLVLDLNKGRNVSGKDGSGDTVSQIVSVLNAHLDSLQYLDESSSGLQKRLADVSRACEVVSRETDRMYTRRSAGLY